jgi:hypothetical protein
MLILCSKKAIGVQVSASSLLIAIADANFKVIQGGNE